MLQFFIVMFEFIKAIRFLKRDSNGQFAVLRSLLAKKQDVFWIFLDILFNALIASVLAAHAFERSFQPDFSQYHVSEIPPFTSNFISVMGFQKVAASILMMLIAVKSFRCLSRCLGACGIFSH